MAGKPYDHASCETLMKTLKRKEAYYSLARGLRGNFTPMTFLALQRRRLVKEHWIPVDEFCQRVTLFALYMSMAAS